MDIFRYVIAVLTVIGLPPAFAWWFVVHPFIGFWRRVGVKGTLWAVAVMMTVGTLSLIAVRNALVGPDLGTSWPLAAAGFVLMAVAFWIGVKRRKYLTTRILVGVPELQADGRGGSLLVEGPYAVVRHPRYVEVTVGMLGYALVANYLGVYLMVLVGIPLLHAIVLLEERELARRFGAEWDAYAARVPRWVPRPRASAAAATPPR